MFGAIDVGGTKTLLATFDSKGKLIKSVRFATPQDYNDFIDEIKKQTENINLHNLKVMTVAMPGLVDVNKGVVKAFGNRPWLNIPIRSDVEKIFKCPVYVENDAKIAGLFQSVLLKHKYRKLLYVTISTGIGAGLIINGKISSDFDNIEVGEMIFEHEGKLQRWQKFASGKAIVAKFGMQASEIKDPKAWYIIAHNIAVGMIDLIASLTPDIIVIGGGVGSHFDRFGERLIEDLKIYESPLLTVPPIIEADKPEETVIYGCYYFGRDNYEARNN